MRKFATKSKKAKQENEKQGKTTIENPKFKNLQDILCDDEYYHLLLQAAIGEGESVKQQLQYQIE